MTDKEKLEAIRAEIHRLVDVRGYDKEMANDLFTFMDSLPNEPVSSVWHDASEKLNEPEDVVIISPSDNTGEVLTRCVNVYQGHIWAYTSVLLKLDNTCNIGKNLQEPQVKELEETRHVNETCKNSSNSLTQEPVNKDFEMALAEMIDKAQKCVVEPLVIAEQWKDELIKLAKSEEPVSEEFEEALAREWQGYNDRGAATVDALEDNTQELAFAKGFYRGAKWQKSKDAKLIINAKDDGYRLGLSTMKQQMMKDATSVTVHIEAGNYPYIPQIELYDYDKDTPLAKEGDKYKVIVIKED